MEEDGPGFASPVSGRRVRRVDSSASPRKGTNELSPRKVPRSPLRPPPTPPNWKRPQEVMRLHRLKRTSLTSKFKNTEERDINLARNTSSADTDQKFHLQPSTKRKNPFSVGDVQESWDASPSKRCRSQNSVFRLLALTEPTTTSRTIDLQSIVDRIKQQSQPQGVRDGGRRFLPVDWSLRTKLRFLSAKPFPWDQTLKTCEEASAVSGFVRCQNGCPDTSPNALLHKLSLYWQYPWLPWLHLYPRHDSKQNTDKSLPSFASHPLVRETLLSDFTDSFASAFQLLRARHCPYFYVIYNGFSCLFKAAGVGGTPEASAVISPTTHGFRQQLRDNDVEFSLPLKGKCKEQTSTESDKQLDNKGETATTAPEEEEEEADEELETTRWLTNLGLPIGHLDKLSPTYLKEESCSGGEGGVDSDSSAVWVEGGEVQSLFNLLLNLKGYTTATGPYAGVPPTILAPVAFTGATLTSLRVRSSVVQGEGGESYHSMEVSGPIMPLTIHRLCNLLHSYLDDFTVTCATDLRTKPFSSATCGRLKRMDVSLGGPAFSIENLSDCGVEAVLLGVLCSDDITHFNNIKFSDQVYTLT